jgi:hypothetical protein
MAEKTGLPRMAGEVFISRVSVVRSHPPLETAEKVRLSPTLALEPASEWDGALKTDGCAATLSH